MLGQKRKRLTLRMCGEKEGALCKKKGAVVCRDTGELKSNTKWLKTQGTETWWRWRDQSVQST